MSTRIDTAKRDLASFFAALADENRLRLLHLMKRGEICVCYLRAVLQTNQPKISRHLAYLKKAGLVSARREGKWMHYRLNKLDSTRKKILNETLRHLGTCAEIQNDLRRLRQIHCCPPRYGIAKVESKPNRCR